MSHAFLRSASAVLLLSATIAASPACAASRTRLYVRFGPPAPIVETRVIAPGPGYVWIPGYHRWSGSAYVWVPGRWDRPPRARAVWVPGRWVRDHDGWYISSIVTGGKTEAVMSELVNGELVNWSHSRNF